MAGRQTAHGLRAQLKDIPEQGLAPDPNARKFSYEELQQALSAIWGKRTDRYSELRSEATVNLPKVEMSYIGG